MSQIIKHLAVIGVGLIGGSFARALRETGSVGSITGIDTDRDNLEQALALGIVDGIAHNAAEGVRDAQVVFVSAPVCSIPAVVREIAPHLGSGCIVSDGGSVKSAIVRECEALMPPGCFFIGGLCHPFSRQTLYPYPDRTDRCRGI